MIRQRRAPVALALARRHRFDGDQLTTVIGGGARAHAAALLARQCRSRVVRPDCSGA
jgi:hypothetical protein